MLQKLRDVRKKRNKTMEEMGKALGVSKVAYWKIEHGKTKVSFEASQQISEILNIDKDSLFLQNK
ncbi:helix-turn-helix domain-containing protein [Fructilactobacillus sanfranciscensis]|uniref:helix-turn-helix domain-containing protein n=1 Tax=Fructilactobacillus sanfranciscensis TaxID=1625 RepID=UPI0011185517|nr:helix-turn-helix transcriptional regulator [Fructilactobacillus sanfranciscensis]TNK96732.1 XRE family transcriptional regulator [Fructilactobacillus sanfranciscensis]